jgi:hypothetical protein
MRSKELFPTWRTILRVDPTSDHLPRLYSGCDTLWGEYHLARGPIATYKATRLEAAQDLDADLIFGLHYYDFGGVQSDRPITPAELRHYGGILADTSVTIAMGGWKYTTQMWNQPGFPDALRYVRDLFASRDP